jgi:hypothetical protein
VTNRMTERRFRGKSAGQSVGTGHYESNDSRSFSGFIGAGQDWVSTSILADGLPVHGHSRDYLSHMPQLYRVTGCVIGKGRTGQNYRRGIYAVSPPRYDTEVPSIPENEEHSS